MNADLLRQRLLPTLHEDDDLLVLVKPAGVDVGGLEKQSAPGLLELLHSAEMVKGELHVVNRLSRYESGIIVFAKSEKTARALRDQLKGGRWQLEYTAVVLGRVSKPQMALGGRREPEVVKSVGRRGRSQRPARRTQRHAEHTDSATNPVRLQRLQEGESRSLVRCTTHLSTTHALRAQLRAARLRVLGDLLHDQSRRPRSQSDTCLHLSRAVFEHPTTGRRLNLTSQPPQAFSQSLHGERDFERSLHAALVRRMDLLTAAATDAFRVLAGPAEDIDFLVADKFGDVIILQVSEPTERVMRHVTSIARWLKHWLEARAVYAKYFVRNRDDIDPDLLEQMHSPKPLVGEIAPETIEFRERGLRFSIKPYDGFSVGLFLDQRDNRHRIRQLSKGKDVLNLFAYTCGFSVAAAAGGARKAVSVDVSANALEWGKRNFALNNLDIEAHEFYASDAMEFLKRAKKKERLFDIVVLDPPSFAHGRKSKTKFSIVEDLPELVRAAAEVVRPGGMMMLSTNHRKLSVRDLVKSIEVGAGKRRYEIVDTPRLPADFAVDPGFAKTILVRFDSGSAVTGPSSRSPKRRVVLAPGSTGNAR